MRSGAVDTPYSCALRVIDKGGRDSDPRDVTDDYEWYEVVAYLREDAGKMRALLPQQGMRVVPGGRTS